MLPGLDALPLRREFARLFQRAVGVAFSYTQSVAQSGLASATPTKVTFTSPEYDHCRGAYASSRFTAKAAGVYRFNAGVYLQATATTAYELYFYKNGLAVKRLATRTGLNGSGWQDSGSADIQLAVGDYVEVYASATSVNPISTNNTASVTYFQGALVRPS